MRQVANRFVFMIISNYFTPADSRSLSPYNWGYHGFISPPTIILAINSVPCQQNLQHTQIPSGKTPQKVLPSCKSVYPATLCKALADCLVRHKNSKGLNHIYLLPVLDHYIKCNNNIYTEESNA